MSNMKEIPAHILAWEDRHNTSLRGTDLICAYEDAATYRHAEAAAPGAKTQEDRHQRAVRHSMALEGQTVENPPAQNLIKP